MWKLLEILSRRMVLSALLATSIASAAFAFGSAAYAREDGCGKCLFITHCIGDPCVDENQCGGDYCCPPC
jgi:hypothetical protein